MAQNSYQLSTDALSEVVASDALALTDLFISVDPATYFPTTATGTQLTALVNASAKTVLTEAVTDETEAVDAAESGKVYVQTRSSTTCTFTLPAAAAGLTYTFVCGHASSEILITPATGDAIVGKAHGAENAGGLAPAAGTGIKNTAATNVVGDHCTLVALDTTTWYMTSVAGVWAAQP
jgi:hypothetical protein